MYTNSAQKWVHPPESKKNNWILQFQILIQLPVGFCQFIFNINLRD